MIALRFATPVDFLEYMLQDHAASNTIVICSSREAFLEDVLLSIRQSAVEPTAETMEEGHIGSRHSLMTPTIHLLARSRTIGIAFTPTLPHLRAYIASIGLNVGIDPGVTADTNPEAQSPTLAIFGLTEIHRSTSEYSAQGLSRTLSAAVEASLALGRKLIIAEPLTAIKDEDAMASSNQEDEAPSDPWMEQIPILNNSIRSGGDQRVWAGRTIEVARVVGRWCRIARTDQGLNVV